MKHIHYLTTFITAAALVLAALPGGNVLADDLTAHTTGPIPSAVLLTPNPATFNTSVVVTATLDDTGISTIQSAEFSVNGGAWTAMAAVDGLFDTAIENVTATFTASSIGTYKVCVRGTDALSNVGKAACDPLTVQSIYTFTGFRPPIKTGKANKPNAPQTIPVKWTLTLTSDGSAVSDKTSFVAVKSYAVDCITLAGDISSAVVEKSPGKTGVKYHGLGKWRFSWKTPITYHQTCRMMFVLFGDGAMSPQVLFRFK